MTTGKTIALTRWTFVSKVMSMLLNMLSRLVTTFLHFQGKPFNITEIQVYAPTTNAKEAECFCEDLHHLLEQTPKKDVFFIIEDWNAKAGR